MSRYFEGGELVSEALLQDSALTCAENFTKPVDEIKNVAVWITYVRSPANQVSKNTPLVSHGHSLQCTTSQLDRRMLRTQCVRTPRSPALFSRSATHRTCLGEPTVCPSDTKSLMAQHHTRCKC
jgi:hypothetical protein